MEKDPNDSELGIPSKNTDVVHAQCGVSAMLFSPTKQAKQPTSIAKT